jgi:hypothetical protein
MLRGFSKLLLKQKNSACLDFSKANELGHNSANNMIREYCN